MIIKIKYELESLRTYITNTNITCFVKANIIVTLVNYLNNHYTGNSVTPKLLSN